MSPKLGVVVAELNPRVTGRMLEFLLKEVAKFDAEVVHVCKVPGLLEAPLFVKELLKKEDVQAVIVLGSIVKETSLEDFIFNQVISKLIDLSLTFEKPVTFGIAGPGIYWSESLSRVGAEEYARMALLAALESLKGIEELRKSL